MVQNQGNLTTLHEIFAGVGSGMFTLETNRPLDMDDALQEKLSLPFIQGLL